MRRRLRSRAGTIGRYTLLPGSPFLMGASFVNLLNY